MANLSIRDVFANALERPSEADRQAYLDRACAGAPELRKRVEELLRAYKKNAVIDKNAPDLLASDPNLTAEFVETPRDPDQTTPADSKRILEHRAKGESAADADRIGETIGGYELIRKLGDGGMGTVYLGEKRDGKDVLRVAIKLIKPDKVNPQLLARFKAERRILTRLNHGNIAKVFDMGVHAAASEVGGTERQEPYFIMEYVADKDAPGHTLDGYCSSNKLAIRDRLALFEAICRGVEHAHLSGVTHRDLKGLNILVAVPRDGQPVPKVIDFGLAKALEEDLDVDAGLTVPGVFMGTPAYASPEQASGEVGIGPRTDVYALGVILYRLLTGALPIDLAGVRNHIEMMNRIHDEIPALPSAKVTARAESLAKVAEERRIEPAQLPALLRGDLDWVVKKALEKNPADRYATAGALADEVRRVLDGEPVEAGPDSRWHRAKRFIRRNRPLVASASVVFLTLILGIVGLVVGLAEVSAAKDRETAAKDKEIAAKKDVERAVNGRRGAMGNSRNVIRTQIRSGDAIDHDRRESYRNILVGLRGLAEENPGDSRAARELSAETSFDLANLALLLGLPEAGTSFDEAIRKYDSLRSDYPDATDYTKELARCHFDRGHQRQRSGRLAEAIAEFETAIKLFQEVPATEAAHHRELANVWNDMGVALKRRGELPGAEKAIRKAIEAGEKADALEPGREVFLIALAMSHHNLGNIVRDQGKPRESIEAYRKAVALTRPLAKAYGEGGKSRTASKVLLETCWDRANARGQLGLHAEAYADWNAACQLNEIDPFYNGEFLGRFRAAAELEMKHQGKIPANVAYPAAKINAQAFKAAQKTSEPTLMNQYAKRVYELLNQAKAAGHFRDANAVGAFKADPDFSVLPPELLAAVLSGMPGEPKPKK